MVTLYVSPGSVSCRKAKKWFLENDIPFKERNMFSESLTLNEIKEILRLTDNGTDDIISTRSKAFQKMDVDLEQLPLNDLYRFIQKNPGILKSPIICDERRFQVGYHEEQIRRFLPRSVRALKFHEIQKMIH
ncbi:transcriptional regulator Spx [Oceanobacillus salinisoli]|uniref:transcriptional regulator Spx n=1 Tax=Oceanobacillus salinisoli TaxID=2678611 RepID=UPI0012E16A14|nr:transcriptional regulator Spx [Oceanobacillus salinisoli]